MHVASLDERFLIVGLTRRNLGRLRQGKPIVLSRETHGEVVPPNIRLILYFGKTEDEMMSNLATIVSTLTDKVLAKRYEDGEIPFDESAADSDKSLCPDYTGKLSSGDK